MGQSTSQTNVEPKHTHLNLDPPPIEQTIFSTKCLTPNRLQIAIASYCKSSYSQKQIPTDVISLLHKFYGEPNETTLNIEDFSDNIRIYDTTENIYHSITIGSGTCLRGYSNIFKITVLHDLTIGENSSITTKYGILVINVIGNILMLNGSSICNEGQGGIYIKCKN
eukprot:26667_1